MCSVVHLYLTHLFCKLCYLMCSVVHLYLTHLFVNYVT
jgi:hypothetical protein